MPAFDAAAPRIGLKILGHPIQAPAPFTAGHALSEAEARFLNRQVATAVANPMPSAIKAQVEAAGKSLSDVSPAAIQANFDARFAAYELGVTSRAAPSASDPTSKIVHRLGVDFVTELLKSKGKKVADYRAAKNAEGVSQFEVLVAAAIERNPQWVDVAKAQLEALGQPTGDEFDLPDVPSAPVKTQTPADTETVAA